MVQRYANGFEQDWAQVNEPLPGAAFAVIDYLRNSALASLDRADLNIVWRVIPLE
jgi:hypothetical protein